MSFVFNRYRAFASNPSTGPFPSNRSRKTKRCGVVRKFALMATIGLLGVWSGDLRAEDNDIRIGNTMPYSGPASAYGLIGKAIGAYFDKVNDEGDVPQPLDWRYRLGLVIALGIIERQHLGSIEITDAPGGGARLIISLPAL